MKWTIPQLRKTEKPFTINEVMSFPELTNLSDVVKAEQANVTIICSEVGYEEFLFQISISIDLVMRCAVSLEPTPHHLDINMTVLFTSKDVESYGDAVIITDNTIDLTQLIYSEIVVFIPMKVVKEGYEDIYEKD